MFWFHEMCGLKLLPILKIVLNFKHFSKSQTNCKQVFSLCSVRNTVIGAQLWQGKDQTAYITHDTENTHMKNILTA